MMYRRTPVVSGLTIAAVIFASDVQAQALPPPFEDMEQVVCADQNVAVQLLAVYDKGIDSGDKLLAELAAVGVCERATFSGTLVADVYSGKSPATTGKLREGHVFQVEVTRGAVLKDRTRVYMLLYIVGTNEA
jgi:hypothetical protein